MRTSPRSGDWLTLPGAVAGGTSSTGWSSGGGAAGSLVIALALSAVGASASPGARSAVQAASASASSAIAGVIGFMRSAPCGKTAQSLDDAALTHCERAGRGQVRSEEHTSELQSLMRISYAVFCLQKKTKQYTTQRY